MAQALRFVLESTAESSHLQNRSIKSTQIKKYSCSISKFRYPMNMLNILILENMQNLRMLFVRIPLCCLDPGKILYTHSRCVCKNPSLNDYNT